MTGPTASDTTLRIGIAGVGFMGRQHADYVRERADVTLVAVADPAADLGDVECAAHRSLAEMLETEQLDGVIIANPNALHVASAIEVLEHGVAVLLEKPAATSYAEALRLAQAVDDLDGRLVVGHHRRHHPAVATARRSIAAGDLGDVVAVSGLWSARKDDPYFADVAWHREPGAGVTLINLVHDLDLLRFLCGEVAEVQATASSHARGLAVEDTIAVNLRFEGGAVGSFLASDAGVSPWGWDQATRDAAAFPYIPGTSAYQVVGTRGALSVPDLATYSYGADIAPNWHSPLSRTYLAVEEGNSFRAQLAHFTEVVRGIAAPLVPADDAARTIALVEAVAYAAQRQETVDVARYSAAAGHPSMATAEVFPR